MKAYKNRKGNIMSVFKNNDGLYTVYIKQIEKGNFVKYQPNPYPARASRFEAETDLCVLVARSTDKSWTEVSL